MKKSRYDCNLIPGCNLRESYLISMEYITFVMNLHVLKLHNLHLQIYISLEGVVQDKMEAEFKQWSFDVKFHDVQAKNCRFTIPRLNQEIVPEKSKVLVKPTRVVIMLFKASKGNWLDLQYKEDKVITYNGNI